MQHTPQRLLATTTRSTFELLALLYAEPAHAPPAGGASHEALGTGALLARVPFAGVAGGEAVEGALVVGVSRAVADALAENMLGGAAGDAQRRDALGEFANVVCGHVLSEAGGPSAVFSLGAPEHGAALGLPPDAWRAWLDVESGVACVALDAPASLFVATGALTPAAGVGA